MDGSGHYSSKSFGMGSLWRRVVDWFPWSQFGDPFQPEKAKLWVVSVPIL